MKFSEMPYARIDCGEVKKELAAMTAALKAAADYPAAREVFLRKDKLERHVSTLYNLASIRHSINTKDEFYDGEVKFWNVAMPELEEELQNWTLALLESPFRADFARDYGEIIFTNAEIRLKSFSPAIIPEMQQESDLAQEYEKLLASAQIPFEGGV
ncbi:MAG: M3 family oligoendopeptidase, partial [Clostridia bacterium]|nr:M3 family oligoendopeptidase [Clostridia bacterium]